MDKLLTDPIKKMDENIKLEMRKYFKRLLCSELCWLFWTPKWKIKMSWKIFITKVYTIRDSTTGLPDLTNR